MLMRVTLPVTSGIASPLLSGNDIHSFYRFGSQELTNVTSRRLLIQILLKADERFPDLIGPAEIRNGISNRTAILESQQRRQLFLIELFHTDAHIMGKNEVKEDLLLAVKVGADFYLGL